MRWKEHSDSDQSLCVRAAEEVKAEEEISEQRGGQKCEQVVGKVRYAVAHHLIASER